MQANVSYRGEKRERSLKRERYFANSYFALSQLCSQAQQIRDIHRMNPVSVIEVGLGNGFTSSFLRRAGFEVTTVDINESLSPDICCSIDEILPKLEEKRFDLLVCCEVLEHMPYEKFSENIRIFREISDNLYMTLPNYCRSFGASGFLRLPKLLKEINFTVDVPIPKKLEKEHFWEVGSSRMTKKKEILRVLGEHYRLSSTKPYTMNPYHLAFTCTQK